MKTSTSEEKSIEVRLIDSSDYYSRHKHRKVKGRKLSYSDKVLLEKVIE